MHKPPTLPLDSTIQLFKRISFTTKLGSFINVVLKILIIKPGYAINMVKSFLFFLEWLLKSFLIHNQKKKKTLLFSLTYLLSAEQ